MNSYKSAPRTPKRKLKRGLTRLFGLKLPIYSPTSSCRLKKSTSTGV